MAMRTQTLNLTCEVKTRVLTGRSDIERSKMGHQNLLFLHFFVYTLTIDILPKQTENSYLVTLGNLAGKTLCAKKYPSLLILS